MIAIAAAAVATFANAGEHADVFPRWWRREGFHSSHSEPISNVRFGVQKRTWMSNEGWASETARYYPALRPGTRR